MAVSKKSKNNKTRGTAATVKAKSTAKKTAKSDTTATKTAKAETARVGKINKSKTGEKAKGKSAGDARTTKEKGKRSGDGPMGKKGVKPENGGTGERGGNFADDGAKERRVKPVPGSARERRVKPAAGKAREKRGGGIAPVRERLAEIRPSGKREDNFFKLVHEVARQVPWGRVTSYGAIAAALGTRMSARMVGWAMNACHLSVEPVPAHRVVNSMGLLTGRHHFNPPERMQELLEEEGTKVADNKVVDFKHKFWNPAEEL